ncbi:MULTISPECIES: hypothetical protein [Actinotignum]|uniref:Uncharacterized protein n=1 Tax=Actinotignum timonense TaxID=1870995 RepID=A0AAW9HP90_9ACTO|nr:MULTISPECIES: hypothetical protein [Actinotignum]MDE1559256.1 hypothetical protein [Actinotignum schaalii]MDE1664235.1 hypothetical protein [Actinotignum schaalii]MDK6373688.1 hypothetical protein [Actinotignum timonense]MDK6419372.1 hypothetical protein [Actinotignum timonense]MDK6646082.1 hypothetical protein [Actinotignum timonense]
MRNSHGNSHGGRAMRLAGLWAAVLAVVAMLVFGATLSAAPASARAVSLPEAQGEPAMQLSSAGQAAPEQARPTVVIGVAGLRWEDVSEKSTPRLSAALAGSGTENLGGYGAALANISVRTAAPTTCAVDGWVSLGAGARAAVTPAGSGCVAPESLVTQDGTVRDAAQISEESSAAHYPVVMGALAQAVAPERALAVGPGAALALNRQAESRIAYRDLADVLADSSVLAGRDLTVIDAGSFDAGNTDSGTVDAGNTKAGSASAGSVPAGSLASLDERLGDIIARVTAHQPQARIIITTVADRAERAELGFFALLEPGETTALARSATTRTTGLVQLIDLAPSVLAWHNGAPTPLTVDNGGKTTLATANATLHGQALRADLTAQLSPQFYLLLAGLGLVCFAVIAAHLVRFHRFPPATVAAAADSSAGASVSQAVTAPAQPTRAEARRARPTGFAQLLAWLAALPVSALLIGIIPWWTFSRPLLGWWSSLAVLAALLATWALAGPRHRALAGERWIAAPLARLGTLSATVIAVDVLVSTLGGGYSLANTSVMGSLPTVAGRFFGFNNSVFAIFAVGTLAAAAALAARIRNAGSSATPNNRATRMAGFAVLAVGACAIALDGLPVFGADAGGPPALTLGFAYLAWHTWGKRWTWWNTALAAIAGVAVSAGLAMLDRAVGSTTHLGNFVGRVEHGGAGAVVARKLSQAFFGLPPLVAGALGATLLVGVCVAVWLVTSGRWDLRARPATAQVHACVTAHPHLAAAAAAGFLALGYASLINDSGLVILGVGVALLAPTFALGLMRAGASSAEYLEDINGQKPGAAAPSNA